MATAIALSGASTGGPNHHLDVVSADIKAQLGHSVLH